jgi:VWFA-related protein
MRNRIFRIFAPCLLQAGFLTAQSPALLPDPNFRVSVNLVQVDVVVTDGKGHHVTDLRADDFEVFESGKRQNIAFFSKIGLRPSQPPSTYSNKPATAKELQDQEIHRSIVLMIDDSAAHSEPEVLSVVAAGKQFINDQMQPSDLIAVTASRGEMGIYQQFTNDKRQIISGLDHIARRPGYGMWEVAPPSVFDEKSGSFVPIPLALGEPQYGYRAAPPPSPIGRLVWAIQSLQNAPGRKAIVLFTHGLAAPPSVVESANRAGVVIYVIDPSGTDLSLDPKPRPDGGFDLGLASRVVPGTAPYRLLAKQTGGLWIKSAPGASLIEDLGEALSDMNDYYLLGYQTQRSEAELAHGAPVRHDVVVKVKDPRLAVRSRNGYLSAANAAKTTPRTTAELLQQALFSPRNAGSIGLRVESLYSASSPDPNTKLRNPILGMILTASGADLTFAATPEGLRKLDCDVLVAVFQEDGALTASHMSALSQTVTPEKAAQIASSGVHAGMSINLIRPGAYQIRVAVRDRASGAIGSSSGFIQVPDFNKHELALSTIALLPSPGENDEAWGEFKAGSTVAFECQVFGVQPASNRRDRRVEMGARVFSERGGAPVMDSHLVPVAAASLAQNKLSGRFQLGKDLEPGHYAMQLIVYDRSAPPRKQIASQWADLTIVKPSN